MTEPLQALVEKWRTEAADCRCKSCHDALLLHANELEVVLATIEQPSASGIEAAFEKLGKEDA